jgi:glycosyltransferase involved in cell wall biosynthesis
MKILNVNCTIDKKTGGGTAERTLKMSQSLHLAGIVCSILSLDMGDEGGENSNEVNTILLPCMSKRFYFPLLTYGTLKKIRAVVLESDIIHLMSHWSVINVIVYIFIRLYRKKYVFCPAGAMVIYGRSKYFKNIYNLVIGNSIIKNASACIAITKDEIKKFEELGIKREKISHIPNGVSANDFVTNGIGVFKNQYGLSNNPFILFIGRLNSIKGPDLLLDAFIKAKDHLRDHMLVFAGPDEGLQKSLQQRAFRNGLESRVKFTGYLNQEQKSRAYAASSFVVIPSRHEAMSIVVLEAGVTKRPVLLTDQCGLDEVGNCGGGIVVSPTVDAISNGLCIMIDELLENNNEMGQNLYRYVEENYSWKIIINRFTTLYSDILSRD